MRKNKHLLIILAVSLLFSACNFPLFADPQEDETNVLVTAVAMTVQAMNNQPLPAESQNGQPTVPPGLPTVTPQPTFTVSAPPTQTPQSCDKAALISETIPDNTVFGPGESFTKSWTLSNIGTCIWNTDYQMKFTSGEAMDGPAAVNLASSVAKDQQITISVDLKAPTSEGTYKGVWNLTNLEGDKFANVWVQIVVESAPFAVTSVYTNLANQNPGACLFTMPYEIYITSSAAGMVTYKIKRSDTGEGPTKSMQFDAAGTKTLESDWDIASTGNYNLEVFIDQPNNQWFGPFNFSVTCP